MTTRVPRAIALTLSGAVATAGAAVLAPPASAAPAPRTQAAASPSPSGSPAPAGTASECAVATTLRLDPLVVLAGRAAQVVVDATPGATVRLMAAAAPGTSYVAVRERAVPEDGHLRLSVTPLTSTRLYAQQTGCDPSESRVLGARTDVGISAVRNGPRDYTFSGGTLPRRTDRLVSLYRVTTGGGQVLTGRARTDSSGRWTVRRVFSGVGRFGFVARTLADDSNLAGTSSVRPTVVH